MTMHDRVFSGDSLSARTPVLPMLLVLVVVLLAGLAYLAFVRLPLWFPGAHVVIAVVLGLALTLGALMLLPARMLHSEAALLSHAFDQLHGAQSGRHATALATVIETHDRARRIRRIVPGTQEDIAALLTRTADRFDALARSLFYAPGELPRVQAVLARSDLVVEAIETHGALRARTGGDGKDVEASRAHLRTSIQSLHDALDGLEARAITSLLEKVEVASSTAETLLRR
ncbi:hypothetical protein [Mameliella alba]|uniref:5-bromo-4-chloroindolyl phosphate hydrolysis protein n=1 Tax=Mameliella alba TaxID=561184 RepID=A0A0B3RSC4_9RHOB|nr:hypothetical protein [Mameliella alba]KHQ50857.1 hypothetical protein OA50_04569 [Mameliella alba]